MEFRIACADFVRLSEASLRSDDEIDLRSQREFLASVRLEHINGRSFAVATNSKIMAIELLGPTAEANGFVNVTIADALLMQCRSESDFDSELIITLDPLSGWAVAMTTLGYMYPDNASLPGDLPKHWRDIVPKELPKTNTGGFALYGEIIARLAASAPSGVIVLPKIVSRDVTMLVVDVLDPNWIGLFLTWRPDGAATLYAEIPKWLE